MTLRTMLTGVSGLRAESQALGVVGDNIANINTMGFKRQRAVFAEAMAKSGGSGPEAGSGVTFAGSQQVFSQGSLSNTGISTDCAISGEGFFVVEGNVSGMAGRFYTRAGQFEISGGGALVNPDGLKVQGRLVGSDGSLAAGVTDLTVRAGGLPAQATSAVEVTANLDAQEMVKIVPWDADAPAITGNFATTIMVYDSLGNAHALEIHFRKTESGRWEFHAVVSGSEVNPVVEGNQEVGTGSLVFNEDGTLQSVEKSDPTISVDFAGATAGQAIDLGLGTPTTDGGAGLDGVTQFSSDSGTSSISQDGYAAGALSGISVGSDGMVEGIYTNGQKSPIGQLSIAKFRANEALARGGANLWVETPDSGAAVLGNAGSGGRGAITAGALETSNIDLGEEMVEMIRFQRAYSASSKTMQAADELLSSLLMMKR